MVIPPRLSGETGSSSCRWPAEVIVVDQEYRDELETHLAMLKRQGVISVWHDRRIGAGEDVHGEISENLERAEIVLLLVSPYFLASDYCYDVEMTRALERHEAGEARVIPVILHPCDWKQAPFGRLSATPTDGRPVSKHSNVHDAYLEITESIRWAAAKFSHGSPTEPSTKQEEGHLVRAAPRSSNLRVTKTFSDSERDTFRDESFEYIANFFENSLNELKGRNPELTSRFRRIDKNRFSAAVYTHGERASACEIWIGNTSFGDIAYSIGESGHSQSVNESLSIDHDGHVPTLRPLGISLRNQSDGPLTQEGAAEYFWAIFMEPLQRR